MIFKRGDVVSHWFAGRGIFLGMIRGRRVLVSWDNGSTGIAYVYDLRPPAHG